jgi:hypothetical protein
MPPLDRASSNRAQNVFSQSFLDSRPVITASHGAELVRSAKPHSQG